MGTLESANAARPPRCFEGAALPSALLHSNELLHSLLGCALQASEVHARCDALPAVIATVPTLHVVSGRGRSVHQIAHETSRRIVDDQLHVAFLRQAEAQIRS